MIHRGSQSNWARYVGDLYWSDPAFGQFIEIPPLVRDIALATAAIADKLARHSAILAITQFA